MTYSNGKENIVFEQTVLGDVSGKDSKEDKDDTLIADGVTYHYSTKDIDSHVLRILEWQEGNIKYYLSACMDKDSLLEVAQSVEKV